MDRDFEDLYRKLSAKKEFSNSELTGFIKELIKIISYKMDDLEENQRDIYFELSKMNRQIENFNEEYDEFDEDEMISVLCPYCNEKVEIEIDDVDIEDDIRCPFCNKVFEVSWEE